MSTQTKMQATLKTAVKTTLAAMTLMLASSAGYAGGFALESATARSIKASGETNATIVPEPRASSPEYVKMPESRNTSGLKELHGSVSLDKGSKELSVAYNTKSQRHDDHIMLGEERFTMLRVNIDEKPEYYYYFEAYKNHADSTLLNLAQLRLKVLYIKDSSLMAAIVKAPKKYVKNLSDYRLTNEISCRAGDNALVVFENEKRATVEANCVFLK